MQKYLAAVLWAAICITPFQVVGQPSWINEDLVIHIPFDGIVEDVSKGIEVENFGVELDQDRFGIENSSGKFVKNDRTGLLIVRDQIDYSGGDWTISMWLKEFPREPGDLNQVIGIYQTDLSQPFQTDDLIWFFSLLYDWSVRPLIRLTGTWGERGFSMYDLVTGQQQSLEWNHIVLSIKNERSYRLYVNGNIKNWDTFPPLTENMIIPQGDMFIGQTYDGLMDDFKFYRRTLSQEEVTQLYQHESEGLVDSDRDGIYDFEEIKIGTDPTKRDTDGDRLSDGVEIEIGTNPLQIDTDFDGYDDWYEKNRTRTDPTKSDTDGDGFEDFQELENNSDPTDPESFPENLLIYPSIELNFGTREGKTYQLQYSPDLENWADYQEPFDGTGNKVTIFVSIKNTNMKYFRLNTVE